MHKHLTVGKVLQYLILIIMLVILGGPILWQISLAIKGPGDNMYAIPPYLIPTDPTMNNFTKAFEQLPIFGYMKNSLILCAMSITGNVLGSAFAGYALAMLKFKGRNLAIFLIFATMIIPGETTLVSNYLTIRSLDLQNTLLAAALPGLVGAINVVLMMNTFKNIPRELVEAAAVDGASPWQRFWRICLPQAKGTASMIAIFSFIGAWNDFLWPLIVLSDDDHYTLTLGLNRLQGAFVTDPRLIAAGSVIAIVPIIIFFFIFQRHLFKGLESGGLKF